MPRFLANIDMGQNQVLSLVLEILEEAPSTPIAGQVYYDSTLNKGRFYDGTEWVDMGGGGGGDANTLEGQSGAYYLARENHTGTQLAETISDLETVVQAYPLDAFASPNGAVSWNGQAITNLAYPENPSDAANKQYVDARVQGLDIKGSVRAATTENITLFDIQTIDGVALDEADRVLVKNQDNPEENGIYAASGGSWLRTEDANSSALVTPSMFIFVEEGTTQADTGWVLVTDQEVVLDTTELEFVQFSGAGMITPGVGLVKTGNVIELDVAAGYGVRKFSADVGDGSATSIDITHDFDTRDVTVELYANSGDYDTVGIDIKRPTTDMITLVFAAAPAVDAYRVVITG